MSHRYDPTQYERQHHVNTHDAERCCPNCHNGIRQSVQDEDGWYICRCGCEWTPDYRPAWERDDD